MAAKYEYPETKSGLTVAEVTSDRLFGLALERTDGTSFSDQSIWRYLRAAEDFLERDLQMFLRPVKVVTEPKAGVTYDVAEAAYDYEQDFFRGDRWGFLKLRHHPVRAVTSMSFGFPSVDNVVFNVPAEWIRIDKDFGLVRLVPTSLAVYTTFTALLFSLFRGGMTVPQAIFVAYEAGFTPDQLVDDHNDLLDAVKRRAVVEVIPVLAAMKFQDGASLSVSADGLTQSRGGGDQMFAKLVEQYRKDDESFRRAWRDNAKGISLMVA